MPEWGQDNLSDLIRGHIPAALRFARRLTGNCHDAEDVVQESLLRAAKSIENFRGDASFRTWLTRIMINVHRTRTSRQRDTESLAEREVTDGSPTADQSVVADETSAAIFAAVEELPPRQKEVLVLLTWEDFSVTEVADLLAMTQQNVYVTLSAARSQLRQKLAHRRLAGDGHPLSIPPGEASLPAQPRDATKP